MHLVTILTIQEKLNAKAVESKKKRIVKLKKLEKNQLIITGIIEIIVIIGMKEEGMI